MKQYKYVMVELDYSKFIPKVVVKENNKKDIIECFEDEDLSKHDHRFIQVNEHYNCLEHKININRSALLLFDFNSCNMWRNLIFIQKHYLLEKFYYLYYYKIYYRGYLYK